MARPHKPIEMSVVAERVEEDADVSELVSRLEAEADREVVPGTVSLRWGKGQIAVVKRAAAILDHFASESPVLVDSDFTNHSVHGVADHVAAGDARSFVEHPVHRQTHGRLAAKLIVAV